MFFNPPYKIKLWKIIITQFTLDVLVFCYLKCLFLVYSKCDFYSVKIASSLFKFYASIYISGHENHC